MAQRVVLTHGSPNLSYQSAAQSAEGALESANDTTSESVAADVPARRFPGWMRLAIIGSGAVLSWVAVAGVAGWPRH